ncbi:MAG: ATP-binding protein [Alphaproteobacteria bacterium]|nr:ATP-binding protein [Alphaproteobacteria bacterium]
MVSLTEVERAGAFIATKEHRRFVEFATAVRRHRTIGLCFGPAGVGKTLSARRYAHWDEAEPMIEGWGLSMDARKALEEKLARTRTAFYTPTIIGTLRDLRDTMGQSLVLVSACIEAQIEREGGRVLRRDRNRMVELIIIDEAERMQTAALELVRDIFDRTSRGVILIGMPGMERRLARYPQLYSRVGFAHHYRALTGDELSFVLTRHWRRLGLELNEADFTDAQAIASIARITGGNFRLLQRLFVQIGRILKINDLSAVTDDVVHAARATLVIGAT